MAEEVERGETFLGKPAGPERRAHARYSSGRFVTCQVVAAGSDQVQWARVVNVSVKGIGLLTPIPLAPGTTLKIALAKGASGSIRLLEGRVMHTREEAPGRHLVGVLFRTELDFNELRTLIEESLLG